VIYRALKIIEGRIKEHGEALNSPASVRNYLKLLLAGEEREVFTVLFLDAQNRVTASEVLFVGTLTQTAVYPSEVVKRVIHHNAASVILAHNHPSGAAEPSNADQVLTQALKNALALVDVRVLDHFIIGSEAVLSFAERGLMSARGITEETPAAKVKKSTNKSKKSTKKEVKKSEERVA
jgi:DNA repair protein RadC